MLPNAFFNTMTLIENATACEIRSVIHFLKAKQVKPIDIHREICKLYGENAMNDLMI